MNALRRAFPAVPLGRVAKLNARILPETTEPDFEFRYIDIGSVGRGTLVEEPQTLAFESAPSRARRVLRPGDTIVSTVRTYLRAVLTIREDAGDLIASTGFAVLSPEAGLDNRFLGWYAQSDPFIEEVVARSVGVSYPAIAPSELARLAVPLPTVAQQRAIANFLDAETARIDALIDKKQRLADLLQEELSARSESLALGRPESGFSTKQRPVEGPLASVPAGWRFERNKTFLREVADLSVDGSEELLSVSHLTGVTPRTEKNVTMFMAESLEGYKRVRSGDLVVNTMWAWMGALGVSPVDGIVSPAYGVYRFDQRVADPAYFDSVFRSSAYVAEMTRRSTGVWTSRLRLYPDVFLALRSPVPAPAEQRRIARSISQVSTQVSELAGRLRRAILLLKERRQAVITAAVTGELEVPEAA